MWTVLFFYIAQSHLVFSMLFLLYVLLRKNSKFFTLNRCFLNGILICAYLFPLLPRFNLGNKTNTFLFFPVDVLPAQLLTNHSIKTASHWLFGSYQKSLFSASSYDYLNLLAAGYLLVVCVLWVRFLCCLYGLLSFLKSNPGQIRQGIIYHYVDKDYTAFSFFNHIVVSRHHPDVSYLLAHEQVHVKQKHSWDMMWIELSNILLWCNPLIRQFKNCAKINLEHLVDHTVIHQGIDKKSYQYSILKWTQLKQDKSNLCNSFNASSIRQRIEMMNFYAPLKSYVLLYLLAIPLLWLAFSLSVPFYMRALSVQKMPAFEGYYYIKEDPSLVVHVFKKSHWLTVRQMWDGQETVYDLLTNGSFLSGYWPYAQDLQRAPLAFVDNNKDIEALSFVENNQYQFKKLSSSYRYEDPLSIELTKAELEPFEGYYYIDDDGEDVYAEIKVVEKQLRMRLLPTEQEFYFVPESPTRFFSPGIDYPLDFKMGADKRVTHMVTHREYTWTRLHKTPYVDHEFRTYSAHLLHRYEGLYSYQSPGGVRYQVQIFSDSNTLYLNQLWNGVTLMFLPRNTLELFSDQSGEQMRFFEVDFYDPYFSHFLRFSATGLSMQSKLVPKESVVTWNKETP